MPLKECSKSGNTPMACHERLVGLCEGSILLWRRNQNTVTISKMAIMPWLSSILLKLVIGLITELQKQGLPYRRQSSPVTQQFLGWTKILLGICVTTRQPQFWHYWESDRRRNWTKISLPSTTPHVGKKSSGWSKLKVTGIRVGKRIAAH